MRIEQRPRAADAGAAAPLSQHVPAVHVHDAAGAARPTTWASCGWRWKRRRSTTVLLVSLYRTPASLEAAWKYFILCGVGIAQALFGTILLYFAAEKVLGAGGGALLWTHLDAVKGAARADGAVARVRVPARRLRHQGRPGAAAQLAARRARRRPDAGLGGALRAAAQRRAVRRRALQGARRRRARTPHFARQPDDGLRPAVGGGRRVLPVAPEGHQAPVRLLVDRAHGPHHVRLRHGRPGRELRRRCCT